MKKQKTWLVLTLIAHSLACIECDCNNPESKFCNNICFGPGETGEELPELACTFDGVCVLDQDPLGDVVQDAIADGFFKPYVLDGTCEFPVWEWYGLGFYFPIALNDENTDDAMFPQFGYCPEMDHTEGYNGPKSLSSPLRNFEICWPERDAWSPLLEQGAVSRPLSREWPEMADCDHLPLYVFGYEWSYRMYCADAVYCLSGRDECACMCRDGDETCTEIVWQLETDYNEMFGEMVCEGYPFRDTVMSGYIGNTCVFIEG